MKVKVKSRPGNQKSDLTKIRLEGDIPAVIYSNGKEGEKVSALGPDFHAVLRKLKPGYLPSTVLTLEGEDGKERRVLVKDIQYHPTTYKVLHLDFEELHDDSQVNVKIPIEMVGAADCVAVKQGAVLRPVIRHMRVRCLPKDIPTHFEIAVKDLELNQSAKLNTITIPEKVRPLIGLQTVAVTVAKR